MSYKFRYLDELSQNPLKIAVVGHTNHGKTSTIRTLCLDAGFGEVEDEAGTTTQIHLKRNHINGKSTFLIYDTPGFENLDDLILGAKKQLKLSGELTIEQLVEHLGQQKSDESKLALKTLQRIKECNLLIYVIDVREPLLEKYLAEIKCLQTSGSPLVVAFNFTKEKNSDRDSWSDHLRRQGIHTYCEFDAHTRTRENETNLFEKMKTLLPEDSVRKKFLESWNQHRSQSAQEAIDNSTAEIFEMASELWEFKVALDNVTKANERSKRKEGQQLLEETVAARKMECIKSVVEEFRFKLEDIVNETSDNTDSDQALSFNVFDTNRLRWISTGSGAVIGGTIDALVGGASFGFGTAIGAIVGFTSAAGYEYKTETGTKTLSVQLNENVLYLLIGLGISSARTLKNRGRANPHEVRLAFDKKAFVPTKELQSLLKESRGSGKPYPELLREEIKAAIEKA